MFGRGSRAKARVAPVNTSVLDQYVREAPSAQQTVDIFAGDWSSQLPASLGVTSGGVALFQDNRIQWLIDEVGGVSGMNVLELGPLEAGHSAMLHDGGAASVVAVEGNTRAYLKCLVVKELLHLDRCHFLLGDFLPYVQQTDEHFDLVLASGVLYHAPDPLALLTALGTAADRIAIWTHYYDPAIIEHDADMMRLFDRQPVRTPWRDRTIDLHRRFYREALQWSGFCGGPEPSALWMERDDLMSVLRDLGFTAISVAFETPDHPHGPSLMLCAQRAS